MKDYLKRYKIVLTVKGPLFIGSGSAVTKKEYIFDEQNSVIHIPDSKKLFNYLIKKNLEQDFESYLLGQSGNLKQWLLSKGITQNDYKNFVAYSLDSGDVETRLVAISHFVKDAFGKPYVPGSSLKGSIRTALLCKILQDNPSLQKNAELGISRADFSQRGKRLFSREIKDIEAKAFNTAKRKNDKPQDINNAVNDIMSGLRISDSEPLDVLDLTICEKNDFDRHGEKKTLNIFRECLKPETKVSFEMVIDSSIFPYDEKFILDGIELFSNNYDSFFNSKFKDKDTFKPNSLFVGGGAGFCSKTVINSVFKERGTAVTSKILNSQFQKHFHLSDVKKGVSPSLIKKTSYRKNRYSFGLCEIEIKAI